VAEGEAAAGAAAAPGSVVVPADVLRRGVRWADSDPHMRELKGRIDDHRARLAAAERDQEARRESS
jgi:hypothetical protein